MKNGVISILSKLKELIRKPRPPSTHRPYPKMRNFILDIMVEGRRKNTFHLLFEADLTPVRRLINQHREATGEHISLTAYFAAALARAIDEDKSMHAYRYKKSKLVLFDEVDLCIMVEQNFEEGAMPINYIIRNANRKKWSEIHKEIQTAKTVPLKPELDLFFKLPTIFRKVIWLFIRHNPFVCKELMGTVGITSAGMHTSGPLFSIPITPMTLTLSIGSISQKLMLEEGTPVEREVIHLSFSVDHDVIDGAPLTRFINRFKKLIAEPNKAWL